ncbi:MAG: O-antigen ligase family protein [Sphingobacterium composti]|uniref:O-antigen ligase family protein n=1 Tax=Sphingobacterium composti TaxID=363260 RepID=UPI0013576D5F|nr:O-antigen ligase family protein [Sphingobacterium composti Ten et al. 2007 non Yoo et al. 2007]
MIKKIMFFVLMFMFMYVTTFNIFMSEIFRIPAPIIFLAPLMIFYKDEDVDFVFGYEAIVFFIATLLYTLLAEQDIASFFAFLIKLACLVMFFNFIIASNIKRFNLAIYIFITLLFLSGIIMLIDHQFKIADLRSMLVFTPITQSPSGISVTLFIFGYQMAALTAFLLPFLILSRKNWLLSLVIMAFAICFIFFGMQRSVLVSFGLSSLLFILFYYRAKSVFILGGIVILLFIGQNFSDQFSSDKNQQNILNKNVKQTNNNEDRGDLMTENLKVIADYPFGLIFYNKSWNDVVWHNHVYKNGSVIITSHNAYLMFITYLGPLIGLLLLLLIYWKLTQIVWNSFKNIRQKENIMLLALSCSFIAISANSMFHNDWLLSANGPTLILYFSLLHLTKIKTNKPIINL